MVSNSLYENDIIWIEISLKLIPKGPVSLNKIPALA